MRFVFGLGLFGVLCLIVAAILSVEGTPTWTFKEVESLEARVTALEEGCRP